ncbi:MAG TPA: hypothetical protein VE082_05555, partial [Desulfobaccales bacterium]|nr:hypothetical protein [Desulfobaccales bacterium]
MNPNLKEKWSEWGNMSQWWDALAGSVLSGADGLGAFLGEQSLTLVQIQKGLSGIQVGRHATYAFEFGKMAELAPALKETLAAWNLESCPVSLAISPHL